MSSNRRRLVNYEGKMIIRLDHTGLEGEAYVRVIEESIRDAGESDTVNRLVLVDATGSVVDKAVLQALKRLTAATSSRISKTAVLGLSGIQMMFLRTVAKLTRSTIKPFDDEQKAIEWLLAP